MHSRDTQHLIFQTGISKYLHIKDPLMLFTYFILSILLHYVDDT